MVGVAGCAATLRATAAPRVRARRARLAVGVPATARVAFGGDQHVLAERGRRWPQIGQRYVAGLRFAARRTVHHGAGGWLAGSIAAPLTATIVASVAVGVGVALAQAERTRRAAKAQRKRARRFTQLPGEPLSQALRRMTLGRWTSRSSCWAKAEEGGGPRQRGGPRDAQGTQAPASTGASAARGARRAAVQARARDPPRRGPAAGRRTRRGGDGRHARRTPASVTHASSAADAH